MTTRLSSAESQANRFAQVRAAHKREIIEDYVELIYHLKTTQGEVKSTELASRFGVSRATVSAVLKRLRAAGWVSGEVYKPIALTREGEQLAKECAARHALVSKFLIALGIDEKAAERDAEGVEHHVGEETLQAFSRFINDKQAASSDDDT